MAPFFCLYIFEVLLAMKCHKQPENKFVVKFKPFLILSLFCLFLHFQAFGSLPAYIFLWISLVIICPTSCAIVALTFANYVLKPFFPACDVPDLAIRLIAACLIRRFKNSSTYFTKYKLFTTSVLICFLVMVVFINCYNVKWSTNTQDISTVGKMAALVAVVLVGIFYALFGACFLVTEFRDQTIPYYL